MKAEVKDSWVGSFALRKEIDWGYDEAKDIVVSIQSDKEDYINSVISRKKLDL